MRHLRAAALFVCLFASVPALVFGRSRTQGTCSQGGNNVSVPGGTAASTTSWNQSFPSCTVTVYLPGTTSAATIYADATGTPRANPFTAALDGSWFFYSDNTANDVRLSGGGITTPFTLGDVQGSPAGTFLADDFSGATGGAKIAACLTAIGTAGGTCDARGLTGAQTISVDPFAGISNPGVLILGAATYTLNSNMTVPSNWKLKFENGGSVNVSTTFTLTINGDFEAPLQKVFTLTGTGAVAFGGTKVPFYYPQWWAGADICAQIMNAHAGLPATGGTIMVPVGTYATCATQIAPTKTIAFRTSGTGSDQNAGQHATARITWTGGAGPMFLLSGTGAAGSTIDGFELNNTTTSLVGFIDVENAASNGIIQNVYIDRPTNKALSYGIKLGDATTGPVNQTTLKDNWVIHAAPIGVWVNYTSAQTYLEGGTYEQNNASGTVNTAGTAVTWISGDKFPTDISWSNAPIAINGVIYKVSSVTSSTALTLVATAGTQTGVTYGRAAQLQLGQGTTGGSQILGAKFTSFSPVNAGTFASEAQSIGLPLIQAIKTLAGQTGFYGCHYEIGINAGLTGHAFEVGTDDAVSSFEFVGGEVGAVQGTGATAAFHLNNSAAKFSVSGIHIYETAANWTASPALIKNDASQEVSALGNFYQISETMATTSGTQGATGVYDCMNSGTAGFLGTCVIPQNVKIPSASAFQFINNAGTGTVTAIDKTAADVVRLGGNTASPNLSFGTDVAINSTPRMLFSSFFPGALTSLWVGGQFVPEKAITVTRIWAIAKTAPVTCGTNAVVRVTDSTTPINVTVSAATNDSGVISQNYAANVSINIQVSTAAVGCATNPQDVNVTIQYRMQ